MANRNGKNYSGGPNSFGRKNYSIHQNDQNAKRRRGGKKAGPGGIGGRNSKGKSGGAMRNGSRGDRSYRGNCDGYNNQVDRNYGGDGFYQEYGYQRNENSYEDGDQGRGFQKFRDQNEPNAFMQRHNNFGTPLNSINRTWYNDAQGDIALGEELQNKTQVEAPEISENKIPPSELVAKVPAEPPPIHLKEPIESKEPKLLHKIKAERVESDTAKPKQKKTVETSSSDSSSESDSSSDEEKPPPSSVQSKTKENPKTSKPVKIKKEPDTSHLEKKKVSKDLPPVVVPPSAPTKSSSSESSSSDSSDEDENVPTMPKPIKAIKSFMPKTEETNEDDVVCLGKQSNIENLIDDDESNESKPCMVCSKQGHSPDQCQSKCKKCSQSVYEIQTVCKNCGETYTQSIQSTPKPPNPFAMFMQFMQFCMSQYSDIGSDIKYPFPQFENPSAPVLGPTPTVEVTRKDIANSKRDRKRNKSGSKHSRKKARTSMNSDKNSDSDSSSKATTSTKKRKKLSKSAGRDVESAQTPLQAQPQIQLPQFGGHFPAHLPFSGGAFGAPGYNPMLAFSQMMGFNPSAMNFTR